VAPIVDCREPDAAGKSSGVETSERCFKEGVSHWPE
jgi:hypothetical protein